MCLVGSLRTARLVQCVSSCVCSMKSTLYIFLLSCILFLRDVVAALPTKSTRTRKPTATATAEEHTKAFSANLLLKC